MPQLDAPDPAAQLTSNTRHMLSRLGVDFGGSDDDADRIHRQSNGGGNEGTASSKEWRKHQHQQQGGGECEEEQQDSGRTENEVDDESVAGDEKPCGGCRCCCGGINFQEELARALGVAVRDDMRLKRKISGILSRAFEESRHEQVMSDLLLTCVR